MLDVFILFFYTLSFIFNLEVFDDLFLIVSLSETIAW